MADDRRIHIKVTHADCEFTFTKGGGPGGQNVNKRSTKARCVHKPSGATGVSHDERSQLENKRTAFMRMARTETFKRWAHIEARRAAGKMQEIDESVERAMRPGNLKLEVKDDNGRWIDAPLDMTLPDTTVEAENGTIIAEHAAYVAGPRPRKIR